MLFAKVSDSPRLDFGQRTRHVAKHAHWKTDSTESPMRPRFLEVPASVYISKLWYIPFADTGKVLNAHVPQCKSVPSNMCAIEDSNQPAHPRKLIRVFVLRMKKTSDPWLSKMRPAKIQISLRKCAGWSESSLGAQVRRDVSGRCGSYRHLPLHVYDAISIGGIR